MTRKPTILSFFCIAVPLFGPTPSTAQPVRENDVPLSGHISADMAARLHTVLNDGKQHVLRVNSSGGEDAPALALAEDIRRNHVPVDVDGLCAGPCANYLFIAASHRTVEPGALVIFAASATSRLAMVPPARTKDVIGDYTNTAQAEKKLLIDAHVNAALLLEPQLQLQTECYSLTSRDRGGKAYVNYKSGFIGWVPSRAYLARAGVPVHGFWPETAGQFQATLQKAFPGGARGNIAYAGVSAPSATATLLARLKTIKECDTGLPPRTHP
jgi:hypothetical protein